MGEAIRKVRVVVADDESRARRLVKTRLEELGGYELVGEAGTGAEVVALIARLKPDLVILDIQMPQGSGIEIFEKIGVEGMPATVFVTAYSDFAVKAFELYAVDYLLKPFSRERFEEALDRASRRIGEADREGTKGIKAFLDYYTKAQLQPSGPAVGTCSSYLKRIVVTTVEPWRSVETSAIDWIEAEDHFVRIHAKGQMYLVSGRISDYEGQLDPACFLRIHRSLIVNLAAVKKTTRTPFGTVEAVLVDGTKLPVSRGRRNAVRVVMLKREMQR